MSIVPRMTDDARESGAVLLEQFEPLPSTAKPGCAGCKAAQEELDNLDAACAKHAKYVNCYVREPKPGVFSAFHTKDGPKLPGDRVAIPTWEYNLPAMRRILETAEERQARLTAAEQAVNEDRRQKLREIGMLGRATTSARKQRAVADAARAKLGE